MLSHSEMQQIVAPHSSISDQIRALDKAGVKRADIARFLNKRYQHVRNVLEADKQRYHIRPAGAQDSLTVYQTNELRKERQANAEPGDLPAAFFRLRVTPDGNLVLPRHVVEAFGADAGEALIAIALPGELILRTSAAAVARAQELVRTLLPGDDSLADSLIADRRREVEDERCDG